MPSHRKGRINVHCVMFKLYPFASVVNALSQSGPEQQVASVGDSGPVECWAEMHARFEILAGLTQL